MNIQLLSDLHLESNPHFTARPVPGAPPSAANDAIAVVGGLLLYALFVWRGHAWLIGVSPV